ncbi:helix-turn-helix domain-containing protein [Variovorax sp. KK3]|uniref:helix-turn-helix domain-containing protein n=1 Tax=Variovorax sp. KK3 TaxID=1855728 RepID=UPI00097BF8AA|nr:helix-turn-helix domain-containing protein [Variovorax sp. KK3]
MATHSTSNKVPSHAFDRVRVGAHLRQARKERGLTLQALSKRSGVALSTLSKIELGQISVSYDKLGAVAHALGIDIARLFNPGLGSSSSTGRKAPVVVRSTLEDAPGYAGQNYDYLMLATEFPDRRMTPLYGRITARKVADFPDFVRHAGQEFVLVLAGSVRIHFETGEEIALKAQESAYFDSGVGHVYLSTSRVDARVMIVMSEG